MRPAAAAGALAAFLGVTIAGPPGAAPPAAPVNLFQLTARADLIVHVRVSEGALKHALVDVLDTLKGTAPAARLRIAFRELNLDRPAGAPPVAFSDGEEEILFLAPYPSTGRHKAKNFDLFGLVHGAQGRRPLPAEGPRFAIEAVSELAGIAGLDPVMQIQRFSAALGSQNPFLVETALIELGRLRAATPALYREMVRLLSSPRATHRAASLRLLAQVFGSRAAESAAGETGAPYETSDPSDEGRLALSAVIERARNDPDAVTRVAAVAAMGAWPAAGETNQELRAIASVDPDQSVRYEAKKILFKRGITDSTK